MMGQLFDGGPNGRLSDIRRSAIWQEPRQELIYVSWLSSLLQGIMVFERRNFLVVKWVMGVGVVEGLGFE